MSGTPVAEVDESVDKSIVIRSDRAIKNIPVVIRYRPGESGHLSVERSRDGGGWAASVIER